MKQPIIVETTLDAPPGRVWQALTDPGEMRAWYFDVSDFKPEVGFEFQFTGTGHKGEPYLHLCRVLEVVPAHKLSYSWQYQGFAGYTVVSFTLVKEGNKTIIHLMHSGLESFEANNNPDFAIDSFREGWNYLINTALKEYIHKTLV